MSRPTIKDNYYLLTTVLQKDFSKVEELLNTFAFDRQTLVGALTTALRGGNRYISDALARKLNYNMGHVFYYILSNLDSDNYFLGSEDAINRAYDLLQHRGALIDYESMKKICSLLFPSTDKYIARLLEYFLYTTPITENQLHDLYKMVNDRSPNYNSTQVVRNFMDEFTLNKVR